MDATPYVNDDYSELWFKVAEITLPQARTRAAGFARDAIGYHFGRARFIGKETVPLHEHEADAIGDGCCDAEPVPAWHFEVYER